MTTQASSRRAARVPLALAVGVAVVHLVSQLTGPPALTAVSQWLLMPLLAAVVLTCTARPRSRRVRLVLLALGLSWLGDTIPDLVPEAASFPSLVGLFLLAQLAFVAAFATSARRSPVWRRPVLVLPYLAAYAVMITLCAPGAGALLAPVMVYGATLTTAAVLATGVHRLAGIGGAVFVVSDSLIAIGAFTETALPHEDLWVMSTYIAAQALIAAGVLAADSAPTPPRSPATPDPALTPPDPTPPDPTRPDPTRPDPTTQDTATEGSAPPVPAPQDRDRVRTDPGQPTA